MQFTLASSNPGKVKEFNRLFQDLNIDIIAAPQSIEVEEDGKSFNENAFKKAKAYFDEFKVATVADDSGLVVPALPDILGIYSARFMPQLPNYTQKCLKLAELIEGKDRAAYFVCYLCFYISEDEYYFFEGRVHGTIAENLAGQGGFGYDPIFLPDGQKGLSLAQLDEWKMKNSHRAKAVSHAIKFFQGSGMTKK